MTWTKINLRVNTKIVELAMYAMFSSRLTFDSMLNKYIASIIYRQENIFKPNEWVWLRGDKIYFELLVGECDTCECSWKCDREGTEKQARFIRLLFGSRKTKTPTGQVINLVLWYFVRPSTMHSLRALPPFPPPTRIKHSRQKTYSYCFSNSKTLR